MMTSEFYFRKTNMQKFFKKDIYKFKRNMREYYLKIMDFNCSKEKKLLNLLSLEAYPVSLNGMKLIK